MTLAASHVADHPPPGRRRQPPRTAALTGADAAAVRDAAVLVATVLVTTVLVTTGVGPAATADGTPLAAADELVFGRAVARLDGVASAVAAVA